MKKYLFVLFSILACESYTYSQEVVINDLTSSYTISASKMVVGMEKPANLSPEKSIDCFTFDVSELTHFKFTFDKSSKTLLLIITKPTQNGEKNDTYRFFNVDDYNVVHRKRIEIFGSPAKLDIASAKE
jgi:hypothetical protein